MLRNNKILLCQGRGASCSDAVHEGFAGGSIPAHKSDVACTKVERPVLKQKGTTSCLYVAGSFASPVAIIDWCAKLANAFTPSSSTCKCRHPHSSSSF